MALYDSFRLYNSRPMSMYVPAPIEDFKEAQKSLQEKYYLAAQQDDKLLASMSQLQAADFDNDRAMLGQIKDYYSKKLADRSERGDYETMFRETSRDGLMFQRDYAPIKQNLDRYNGWLQQQRERLTKGEITRDRFDAAMVLSRMGYKGIDPQNVEGTMFNGYVPLKHVDIAGELLKVSGDWKANSQESPFHFDGKMWWTKDKTRYVDESEVRNALYQYVTKNPEHMAYINESVMINNIGRQFTEEDVEPYRQKLYNTAITPAEKDRIKALTPTEIANRVQRESLIYDYITPAAKKASFVEYSSESKIDPGVAAMRRKAAEQQLIEERIMGDFTGVYGDNTEIAEMDPFKGVQFENGKVIDYGGKAEDPEIKSRQWNAKTDIHNFKAAAMNSLSERMNNTSKYSKEGQTARQTYDRFKNFTEQDWANHMRGEIEQRRLTNTYELKFNDPKVLNFYNNAIIKQRDFNGRAVQVVGMDGAVTMDQVLEELGLDPDDAKTATKVKSFYDSMRISGLNLMGGIHEENKAMAGAFKFSAIDPNTGKTIYGTIQNNDNVATTALPYSQASLFAVTNTDIGFPVPSGTNLTPAQKEAFYEGHILADPFGQPGHRVIAYNDVNSAGKLVPVYRRQAINPQTGDWVDAPSPESWEQYRTTGKMPKVFEATISDYERMSKAALTNALGNQAIMTNKDKYVEDIDEEED